MARYTKRTLGRTIANEEISHLFIKAYNTAKYLPKSNRSIEEVYNSMSDSKRQEIIDSYLKRNPPFKA